ncbi:MAG: hypothetical protein V3U30_01655 [Thermoplasmata archaeon]
MEPSEKDEMRGKIAELTAQIERIQVAYAENAAPEEAAPSEGPREALPVLPPAPAPPAPPFVRVQSQAESVRAFIAVFVVIFGLGAIVFAWLTMGIDDALGLAAILLGIIASVVGYYFGQRGATRAQMQTEYAMQGWQTSEARTRQLEDWVRWRR